MAHIGTEIMIYQTILWKSLEKLLCICVRFYLFNENKDMHDLNKYKSILNCATQN